MLSREKVVAVSLKTIPRFFQLFFSTSLFAHGIFHTIWWQRQEAANRRSFEELLAYIVFAGSLGLIVAALLWIKKTAAYIHDIAAAAMHGVLAGVCIAGGSFTAAFLTSLESDGPGAFCYTDEESGQEYVMNTMVLWRSCNKAHRMLVANVLIFFLCFGVSTFMLVRTVHGRRGLLKEDEKSAAGDSASSSHIEVVVGKNLE